MKHSTDIISLFMQYLPFHDIFQTLTVCKSWHKLSTKRFFHRLCSARDASVAKDCGKGANVLFNIHDIGELWRKHIMARESIKNSIYIEANEPLHSVLNYCYQNIHNYPIQVEGWRFITQIFDKQTQLYNASEFRPPSIIDINFMKQLINELNIHSSHIQIASKTLGIMCINETNRKMFAQMQCIPKLVQSLSTNIKNKPLISCILWSLVVLSRPIGAIEAQVFDVDKEEHMCNVVQLKQLHCVDILLNIAKTHCTQSVILAKVFWLMVNLSLIGETKQHIVRKGSIEIICNSLRLYPNDKELQYRAIFAIVNLGINPVSKAKMLKENGIHLIMRAIEHYPNDARFLIMCINAIRSLSSQSPAIVAELVQTGAPELFQKITERYKMDCKPLALLTMHTLQTFFHVPTYLNL